MGISNEYCFTSFGENLKLNYTCLLGFRVRLYYLYSLTSISTGSDVSDYPSSSGSSSLA